MVATNDGPSAALAQYVVGLRAEEIPPAVRDYASLLVIDSLGAGLHGATGTAAGLVHEMARARYRDGPAAVWGRSGTMDAAAAALVNATQAHEFELDDYVPAAKLHPGAVIVPAALAVADETVSGAEFITAVVAGYDVMVRVSLAANSVATRRRGWHMTGLAGPFGAAAAAGRILGLDADALVHAFGIAGSCSGGLFAFTSEGSMTKCLHAGRAAESGVVAARLAASGFTGPGGVLHAEDGGLLWAVSDEASLEPLTRALGESFELANAAIKPFPCCGSVHSSIEAVLRLRHEHDLDPDDIVEMVASNSSHVLRQCGFNYQGNGGMLEARMSLQYCMAAAAVDGAVGLRQFEDERRQDAAILALAHRVSFEVDPEIEELYPHRYAARVEIRTRSGGRLQTYVPAPLGTPHNPITRVAAGAKFLDLAAPIVSVDPHRLLKMLRNLEYETCISDLQRMLGKSTTEGFDHIRFKRPSGAEGA